MESRNDGPTIEVDAKEAKTQEKIQKKEAKVQEKEEKKEARDSTTPLKKLISLVEIGALGFLLSRFRKPLETLGKKILTNIEEEAVAVKDTLQQDFITAELALRKAIVNNYLLDPIICYKLGPELYNQLVVNANWHTTIYTSYDPIPATVSAQFTVGTGDGALTATPILCKGISLQVLALCEYLIASGQDLNA